MMNFFSLKNSMIALLLILSIIVSIGSIFLSSESFKNNDHSHKPDAYMEQVIATIRNKNGRPVLKIEAPKMVHYTENDITYITTPYVTLYRQSPRPWYIQSNYAEALKGIDQVIFKDHVILHHPADTENPNTLMNTESLTVFPVKQQAQTDYPITITQPDSVVQAIGMLADLNEGTIKLLSEAKGDYVPGT